MYRSNVAPRRHLSATLAIAGLAAALVLASLSPAEAARRRARKGPVYTPPFAAMVVDAKTGKTLYGKNEDALRHPASITKVMTLYLLFEQLDKGRYRLDSPLKISSSAAAQAPSKLGLEPGETITVDDAIKALVTKSANDIAYAVAENIGGSEEAFAEMMTRKARALGMSRTVFVNASGLPDAEQVTTARDLTILARAVQDRFPRYYSYFSTPSFRYDGAVIRNHNKLLGRVEGVDGIKTGFTRTSGFNLMTSAKSNGRHVVAVVLGGTSGGSRDRIMASLVRAHLPHASAAPRTTALVMEAQADPSRSESKSEPRAEAKSASLFDALKSRIQESEGGEEPRKLPHQPPGVDLSRVRPVYSSDQSRLTTTPSAFRWIAGPQGAARGEGRPVDAALALPQKSVSQSETRKDAKSDVKVEARADTKVEAKVAAKSEARSMEARAAAQKPADVADVKSTQDLGDKVDHRPTGSTGWVIQLGAPEDEGKAKELLAAAKNSTRALRHASPFTEKVVKGGTTLWRARFSGFDPDAAQAACKELKRNGFACFATKG
jgi:D-alanyl-D-alanine carboxypeptidase